MRLLVESGDSRFEHRVLDAGGRPCGLLHVPSRATAARNRAEAAPPSTGSPARPTIEVGEERFHVEYDVVRTPAWGPSDLRFSLFRGEDAEADDGSPRELARIEVRPKRKVRRLSVPAGRFDLVQRHRWFRTCFMVRSAGGDDDVGTIVETTRYLSGGRRTFEIEMPNAVDAPALIFAFFVACKGSWR